MTEIAVGPVEELRPVDEKGGKPKATLLKKFIAAWPWIMAILLIVSMGIYATTYKLSAMELCGEFCKIQGANLTYADGYDCRCAFLHEIHGLNEVHGPAFWPDNNSPLIQK